MTLLSALVILAVTLAAVGAIFYYVFHLIAEAMGWGKET